VPSFLDKDAEPGRLGVPFWSTEYGPNSSIQKFFDNKKYFDFLGVKYIITEGYDFNTISLGVPGRSGQFLELSSQPSFYQNFKSPINSIESMGIGLGATLFEKNDSIFLTFDSIPYDENYHRVEIITDVKNGKLNEFHFDPPLENTIGKIFYFTVHYPESSSEKFVVIYYDEKSDSISNDIVFYENKIKNDSIFIPFTIKPIEKKYSVPFNFHDIYINENSDAFPRVFIVHSLTQVSSNQSQDFLLNHPNFDLRNEVILEESLPDDWIGKFSNKISNPSDSVDIIHFNENNIKIQTHSENAGILVLTDIFYPGWAATIDGDSVKIFKANGLVRAILVPSGDHIIEFEYYPSLFNLGMMISLCTSVILLGTYIFSRKF
jgi:hypothetical protein